MQVLLQDSCVSTYVIDEVTYMHTVWIWKVVVLNLLIPHTSKTVPTEHVHVLRYIATYYHCMQLYPHIHVHACASGQLIMEPLYCGHSVEHLASYPGLSICFIVHWKAGKAWIWGYRAPMCTALLPSRGKSNWSRPSVYMLSHCCLSCVCWHKTSRCIAVTES